MELIDREFLKKTLCDRCEEIAGKCQKGFCGSTKMIDSMPVVDAVLVVRCKDCVHCRESDNWCGVIAGYCGNLDWFCADGI